MLLGLGDTLLKGTVGYNEVVDSDPDDEECSWQAIYSANRVPIQEQLTLKERFG